MIIKAMISILFEPLEPESGFEMLYYVFSILSIPIAFFLDILLLPIEIICLIVGRVKYGRWII